MKGNTIPVVAGLATGIAFIVMFAVLRIPLYPIFADSIYGFHQLREADYTPLLKLEILGLRNSYKVGEAVDFSVRQTAGGGCILPELVQIKEISTGRIIKTWNGTKENALLSCPVILNPATFGLTWTTKDSEDRPIIFNQTGEYAVVAKHMFKTVQQDFKIVAIDTGTERNDNNSIAWSDTSPEVAATLLSKAKTLNIIPVLLEKYPNATLTVTANYNSKLFKEFEKYRPNGIVQYFIAKTEPRLMTPSSPGGYVGRGDVHSLKATLIFDRYYDVNSSPLIVMQCKGKNYSWHSVGDSYIPVSKMDTC